MKTPDNPFYIELFLKNKVRYFQETDDFKLGFSYSHELVVTVMKTYFRKIKVKIRSYRNRKKC